jgi:hypothetical protein
MHHPSQLKLVFDAVVNGIVLLIPFLDYLL